MDIKPFDPLSWAVGLLSTVTLGWAAMTSRQTQQQEIKITVLEVNYLHIKNALERIEKALERSE